MCVSEPRLERCTFLEFVNEVMTAVLLRTSLGKALRHFAAVAFGHHVTISVTSHPSRRPLAVMES